ncbi:hypothetical protein D8S78_01170 [Natrialba swarupiae]|nr:hypothetical protein [Natrialba swarupiae]
MRTDSPFPSIGGEQKIYRRRLAILGEIPGHPSRTDAVSPRPGVRSTVGREPGETEATMTSQRERTATNGRAMCVHRAQPFDRQAVVNR